MNDRSSVVIDGVSKRLGRTLALDNVSIRIGGGVVGVFGPNGAGKSTLLRLIATVSAPDSGCVTVGGLDPRHHNERVEIRRRLGYLPQEVDLSPGFTVFDLVDYVAILKELGDRRRRRDAVEEAIERVGLAEVAYRPIRKLSGGQKRRVGLAAALVGAPPLLVLDEPLAALDPDERARTIGVLTEIGRTGTVVVSTHYPDEVAAFSSRLAVLVEGRLVFDGTPNELASYAGIAEVASAAAGYRNVTATKEHGHDRRPA